jgi:hypothetical protein
MNRKTVMTRMDNAKAEDEGKDENNRRSYRKRDKKKDIIVSGHLSVQSHTLNPPQFQNPKHTLRLVHFQILRSLYDTKPTTVERER